MERYGRSWMKCGKMKISLHKWIRWWMKHGKNENVDEGQGEAPRVVKHSRDGRRARKQVIENLTVDFTET